MGVRGMLLALGSQLMNKEEIKRDWEWQEQMRGDTEKLKDFRADIMDGVDFQAFTVMRQGSPKIKVVHSLAKCPERGMPKEVQRVELGFMGDRRQRREPQPVEIPTQKGWEWRTDKVVKDGVAMKTAYSDPANKDEYWVPALSLTTEEAGVPYMLVVPPIAALFLVEKPRTAEEFFDWLADGTQEASPLWTEAEIKLARDWAVTATQKRGNNSVLALELKSVATDDEAFDSWMSRRLDGTLGPEPDIQTAPQVAPQAAAQGTDPLQMALAAGVGASLQVLRQMGPSQQGQAARQGSQTKPQEKGQLYEAMDFAIPAERSPIHLWNLGNY